MRGGAENETSEVSTGFSCWLSPATLIRPPARWLQTGRRLCRPGWGRSWNVVSSAAATEARPGALSGGQLPQRVHAG